MRNLVLVDFKLDDDWSFSRILNTQGRWAVKSCVTNTPFYHTRLGTIVRYLLYFLFPLRYVLSAWSYGVVLGWQQFYALNYAFWLRLLRIRSSVRIVVMTFIYKEKKGLLGRLYHKYIRYCLTCRHVSKVICYSRAEVAMYSRLFDLPDGLVQFVPLGIEPIDSPGEVVRGDYIFSTGRSNRDYDFLVRALGNTDFSLKIACEQHFDSLPPNVEVLHHCYGSRMYSLLKGCFCVCIPLSDRNLSSGQLVLLQAMQFGKPVLVTCSNGVVDYVVDGKTGFLIDNEPDTFIARLRELAADETLYCKLSSEARRAFAGQYTQECMAWAVLRLL